MNMETLQAPTGLCGYHRTTWKMLTVRGKGRLAKFAEAMCRGGSSRFCSGGSESDR